MAMACADCRRTAPVKPVYVPADEYVGPAGHERRTLCRSCRKRRTWMAKRRR